MASVPPSGGVVWIAGTAHERHCALAGQVWVPDGGGPGPLRADVVADPHVPTFFSERSVLPISQVREVLDEFVMEDSGERAQSVSWVAGGRSRFCGPGSDVWLVLSDVRLGGEGAVPNSFLRVSANRETGYGALIWFVSDAHPGSGDVFDSVWVSDNPSPPTEDSRVVSDTGEPVFHDVQACCRSRVHGVME